MATLTYDSYDGLQEVVAKYLQRENLNDLIPLFIKNAEVRLGNLIKTLPQQVSLPYSLVPAQGTNIVTLPSDFGALIRCTYDNTPLLYISPEQLDMSKTTERTFQFTIIGNNLFLQTYVDGSATLTLYYYQAFEGLSEINESNWLLEDYPTVYLYATLLEAQPYLMDDDRVSLWAEMLTQAINEVENAARIADTPQKTKLTRTHS